MSNMKHSNKNTKRIVNIFSLALILIVVFSTASCTFSKKNNEDNVLKKLIGTQFELHEKRLNEVETPYTLCYQNTDGSVSTYIFYSPIAYRDENGALNLIDTSLGSVKDKNYKKSGYVLQTQGCNINSFFPKKLKKLPIVISDQNTTLSFNVKESYQGKKYKKTIYSDLLGIEHSSVTYYKDSDICIEYVPTSSGVTANITLYKNTADNEITFYVDKQAGMTFSLTDTQNVIISNDSQKAVGIIRTSSNMDLERYSNFVNQIKLQDDEDKIKYSILLNDTDVVYPLSLSVSFEIIPNVLPNISVYENGKNDSLSAYSVMGDSSLFMKLRVNYFIKTYRENIKSATYNFVNFEELSEESVLNFGMVEGFWNVPTISTDNPKVSRSVNNVGVSSSGTYSVDISEYIKECVHDDTYNTENYGLNISSENNEKCIISNYNNSMYKPYVRIDFYDMPWTFEKVDEIYPST